MRMTVEELEYHINRMAGKEIISTFLMGDRWIIFVNGHRFIIGYRHATEMLEAVFYTLDSVREKQKALQ